MQVFRSSKNKFNIIVLWAMAVLMPLPLVFGINEIDVQTGVFLCLIFFGLSGLALWILFDTTYKIDENFLSYSSGPFRGKIKIATIRKIEYDTKWMKTSMYRPALDQNGLVVYYEKYEDIFISPNDKEGFIAALKAINPKIEIR